MYNWTTLLHTWNEHHRKSFILQFKKTNKNKNKKTSVSLPEVATLKKLPKDLWPGLKHAVCGNPGLCPPGNPSLCKHSGGNGVRWYKLAVTLEEQLILLRIKDKMGIFSLRQGQPVPLLGLSCESPHRACTGGRDVDTPSCICPRDAPALPLGRWRGTR